MQSILINLLAFLAIFGLIVVIHEFGHFYFAKKSGILVREFAIGMGPKIFAHTAQDGTVYTIRILPVGGYVRMAGWGEDTTDIKTGQAASLTLNDQGVVTRINLSQKQIDRTSLPISITDYDLEDQLAITGLVLDETRSYPVDHDATIVEEDGTELRIAPLDVQYQNASIWGRLITNFAGPMNNFILGLIAFTLLVFLQGGVVDPSTNQVRVTPDGAVATAGMQSGDAIVEINSKKIDNWEQLITAVNEATADLNEPHPITVTYIRDGKTQTTEVTPKEEKGRYYIGVQPGLKTGLVDKVLGGAKMAWRSAFTILNALKQLIAKPSLDQLGGPVAIYQVSSEAVKGGIQDMLELLALLSINLGIVNLIPIPALDGGKIVLNLIEAVRHKPLKKEIETTVTLAGVAFMVILMLAVTWNDIMRLFN
ncbi:RIP metalloprotease RseP [Streptococcus ovuberis]|uniref:Zinc metalloprotease n=1 Tax=Streptococcus ovuberis TaxID=1936207 RepID=A0A7X6MYK6_9STRE|nr:RIP metalloprotease RseP [Streptococcus ovuberis]NKZ20817.1 RIP metalloprotease RseP [Streptococcus ovuberis]